MVKGGGLIGMVFMLMMLLSPPGVAAENKGLFDSKKFTKQIRLELRVAQVTNHPVLTRGPLDYLQEGGRETPKDNNETNYYLCKDKPALTDDKTLADIAKEFVVASDEQIKELKSKYYCYRFDILSYLIAKHENEALKKTLDSGFDEYFVLLKNPNPYSTLYLFNQAVFAENKEALHLIAQNGSQYLYLALLNFIPQNDDKIIDWTTEIKKREHKYRNRKVGANDLVQAVLHNSQYDLATVKEFIPKNLRQAEYLKALNSLIDIRLQSKN
ncbi:MAG: hypothetical protein J5594_00505 [Elusimicrobiaceae bacterium]|nr:hypothetical protein [Elusimicrobiaceae bacterium]